MNINTIKTTQSFSDYVEEQVKCDNTAWKYKFNNSWNECSYWGGYTCFSKIAQIYIFDVLYLAKGTKLKFPLYVKSYNPELFSSYVFNKVERPTINVKNFIVGNTFTTGQDLNSIELRFYLTPDVKISKPYMLDKYKAVLLGYISTISIYGYSFANLLRQLNTTAKLNLNSDVIATDLRYVNSPANFNLTITPTINGDRYTILNTISSSLSGSGYIEPNCKMTYWIRKFDNWRDCDTWSYRQVATDCKNSSWEYKFKVWEDCSTWS